jgi:phosphatidylserine decarboxylase
MNNPFGLTYYDRHSGEQQSERVFAAGFLYWSYNSRVGRTLTRWVFAQPLVSKAIGWLARRRWSRRWIEPFARHMNVDPREARDQLESYSCFNDYFVREYAQSLTKASTPSTACVAPSDGKLLILPDLDPCESIRIKRSMFNLQALLGSKHLGTWFAGGTAVICRLGLADYHHFHFPVDGVPQQAQAIQGKLYAGGPYGWRWPTSFYAENYRMVTLINSDLFGIVAQIEIGAFTVGSIRQQYDPGQRVNRGDKKGYFELGGSTIVLIFPAGTVKIDSDLCSHSEQQIETNIRIGESIGSEAAVPLRPTRDLHGVAP